MSKHESRASEKGRTFQGEDTAEALVNWLNHSEDEEGKGRIVRVIYLFTKLWFHHRAMKKPKYKKAGYEQWIEIETPDTRKRDELRKLLDAELSYYQTRPWITFHKPFNKKGEQLPLSLHISSLPVPGSELARKMDFQWGKINPLQVGKVDPLRSLHGARMGETGAIRFTLQLFQSGYIFKIHPCRCKKVFFQRFAHQRFCSEKCRIAEFRNSDEARLRRNEYARKLYQLHKTKNVK
jgi:hypothetical protein